MRHNHIVGSSSRDRWAVARNAVKEEVLGQLQEKGEQVRVSMSPKEAEYFAADLLTAAREAREAFAKEQMLAQAGG